MKGFLTTLLALGCLAILIVGNLHWGNKTIVTGVTNNNQGAEEHKPENKEAQTTPISEDQITEALSYAANWPEAAKESLENSLRSNRPYHILFLGSTALSEGESSWPELTKQQLYSTYGEEILTVSIEVLDMNSSEFISSGKVKEIASMGADLIIFEPFTLKDNGVVVIEDSLLNIETVMSTVRDVKEETTFILQPPHPIIGSSWYPVQVQELEKYAATNDIPYFSHWSAWPQQSNDYITPERDAPTNEGHQIWANYIEDALIQQP